MADENIDIEVTGFQSLKSQIKEAQIEYQKLLADVNATPAAVNAAAAKVGELKETLADANDTANAFTTQGKFQAVTKSLAAVAGGFTAIQGAISLAGGDAKDFEKTFQKVQGAMALTQGLTALADMGDAFTNLKKVAVTAFQGIKAAIGSTGIGLLVIALGAIYAYWDDIKAAVTGVDEEQKKLNADSAANLAMQEKQLAAISAQENILKLQGMSEEEIYQLKLDQYDAVIKASKANIINLEVTEKKQIEAAQRNKDILQGIIRFLTIPLTSLLYTVDLIGKALGQDFGLEEKFSGGLAKLVFDPEEIKKEGDKAIEEAKTGLTKLENERAGMILQHDAKRDAEQKTREDKAKAAREKEEDLQKTHLEKIRDLNDQYGELMIEDALDRDAQALRNKQKKERDELQTLIDGYSKRKNLTKAEEESLRVLKAEYDALLLKQSAETAEKQIEIDKKRADQRQANANIIFEKTVQNYKNMSEQQLAIEDEAYTAGLELIKKNLENKKISREEANKQIEDLDKDHSHKLDKIEEDRLARSKQAIQAYYMSLEVAADDDIRALEDKLGNKEITEEEFNAAKKKREETLIKDLAKAKEDYGQAEIDAQNALDGKKRENRQKDAKEDIETAEETAAKKKEIAQGVYDSAIALATGAINLIAEIQKLDNQKALEATKAKFDEEQRLLDEKYQYDINQANLTADQKTDIEKKYADETATLEYDRAKENYDREKLGFENGKKVQYAQAVIAGIQSAMGAFSALAPIPVVGPVLGAIAAAAVAVTTGFQLATIAKTTYSGTPPKKPGAAGGGGGAGGGSGSSGSKFAQGGLLTGRRHSEGGIPTSFGELEGGEYVVNRQATDSFLPLLEQINGMGKGSGASNNLSVAGEQAVAQPAPIIKTYVVATEMSSQQEANKLINNIARL